MIWTVSKRSCRIQCVWLASLVLFAGSTFADPRGPNLPPVIEVFTSAKYPLINTAAKGFGSNLRGLEIIRYEVNGIQSVERDLSLNLPVEPQQSKQIALYRIHTLDEKTRSRMQASATGLAKAMQYGVERYPAVVFNSEAVVYGVADLTLAREQYRVWQTGRRPW
jgi:integrating conjugative element protein (TIGR03757 family)